MHLLQGLAWPRHLQPSAGSRAEGRESPQPPRPSPLTPHPSATARPWSLRKSVASSQSRNSSIRTTPSSGNAVARCVLTVYATFSARRASLRICKQKPITAGSHARTTESACEGQGSCHPRRPGSSRALQAPGVATPATCSVVDTQEGRRRKHLRAQNRLTVKAS